MSTHSLIFDGHAPDGSLAAAVRRELATLNHALLTSRNVTLALEAWLGRDITVHQVALADPPCDSSLRSRLDAGIHEDLLHRHVELRSGDAIVARAGNWHLPGRLPPDVLHALKTTQMGFGRAVLPLSPSRRTLAVRTLWTPPPDLTSLPANTALFAHQALVLDKAGRPLAEVVETYFSEALTLRLKGHHFNLVTE